MEVMRGQLFNQKFFITNLMIPKQDRLILEFLGSLGIFLFTWGLLINYTLLGEDYDLILAGTLGIISFALQELNFIPYPFKPKQ